MLLLSLSVCAPREREREGDAGWDVAMASATRTSQAEPWDDPHHGMEGGIWDLEYVYQLQLEEVMAASIAGMMREEETIHDNPVEVGVVEARIGGIEAVVEEEEVNEDGGERVEEEEEEEVDDGSVVDCEQEHDIEVRAVKTPEGHVGIGALITRNDSVLWRESKYVGIGMSWHVAEYGGVLDAMEVAERLGLRFLNVFVSSRVVSEQVR